MHNALQIASLCYETQASIPYGVSLRRHVTRGPAGDLPGTNLAYAERIDEDPKLVFLVSEHEPKRGYVYALDGGAVYRVDHVDPDDHETVSAAVTRLNDVEAETYPGPA